MLEKCKADMVPRNRTKAPIRSNVDVEDESYRLSVAVVDRSLDWSSVTGHGHPLERGQKNHRCGLHCETT